LFYRFGFFSLSVRVVPRDDAGAWIIREPTAKVISGHEGLVSFVSTQVFTDGSVAKSIRAVEPAVFEADAEIAFADDESELMRAFFAGFSAEGIEQPHQLYDGSWHASTKAKYLGLGKEHFDGDSAFIMIRMKKPEAVIEAAGGQLRPEIQAEAAKLTAGDENAIMQFVKRFGSHYIQRVELGEAVYQVYAMTPEAYAKAKASFLSSGNVASADDLVRFREQHLQSWNVRGVGEPQAASGDRNVQAFLQGKNLIDVAVNPELRMGLESAGAASSSTSVLGLRFSSLRSHLGLRDARAMEFYDRVMNGNAQLWGANI